jgi:hypothetical protein
LAIFEFRLLQGCDKFYHSTDVWSPQHVTLARQLLSVMLRYKLMDALRSLDPHHGAST